MAVNDGEDPAHATAEGVSEQGRFAAREFLARWRRETGEQLSDVAIERLLFTYEMGYLRGRSDAMRDALALYDKTTITNDLRKGNDDDSTESK